jgi:hypothetical protein
MTSDDDDVVAVVARGKLDLLEEYLNDRLGITSSDNDNDGRDIFTRYENCLSVSVGGRAIFCMGLDDGYHQPMTDTTKMSIGLYEPLLAVSDCPLVQSRASEVLWPPRDFHMCYVTACFLAHHAKFPVSRPREPPSVPPSAKELADNYAEITVNAIIEHFKSIGIQDEHVSPDHIRLMSFCRADDEHDDEFKYVHVRMYAYRPIDEDSTWPIMFSVKWVNRGLGGIALVVNNRLMSSVSDSDLLTARVDEIRWEPADFDMCYMAACAFANDIQRSVFAFMAARQRGRQAAERIWRYWAECRDNPSYKMCWNIRMRHLADDDDNIGTIQRA